MGVCRCLGALPPESGGACCRVTAASRQRLCGSAAGDLTLRSCPVLFSPRSVTLAWPVLQIQTTTTQGS